MEGAAAKTSGRHDFFLFPHQKPLWFSGKQNNPTFAEI
jgi:hypothetical protein